MEIDRHSAEVWASWFRCLSDPSRILILHRLATARTPMSVGQLVEHADIGQSTVSHHLAILAETGFVHCEREANTSWYSVNERCLKRFPSAAELIMGVLPRYESRLPDCTPPWHDGGGEVVRPNRRPRRRAHA